VQTKFLFQFQLINRQAIQRTSRGGGLGAEANGCLWAKRPATGGKGV